MKKFLIIFAVILLVAGLFLTGIALVAADFDLTKLGTTKYVEKLYEIDEDFTSISIEGDTEDIDFRLSEDGKCKVVSIETEKTPSSLKVENGKLIIEKNDNRKWYDHIYFISFTGPKIAVYLPKANYEELTVNISTGDICIPKDFNFGNLSVTLSTGDVEISANASESLYVEASTGDVSVSGVNSKKISLETSTGKIKLNSSGATGEISIKASTGDVELNSISNGSLTVKTRTGDVEIDGARIDALSIITDTGDVDLSDVIALGKFKITTDTGEVEFENCDGGDIEITTDTGHVEGTLLSGKSFDVDTDTGKIRVSSSSEGGRCKVRTDTGDIVIEVR